MNKKGKKESLRLHVRIACEYTYTEYNVHRKKLYILTFTCEINCLGKTNGLTLLLQSISKQISKCYSHARIKKKNQSGFRVH